MGDNAIYHSMLSTLHITKWCCLCLEHLEYVSVNRKIVFVDDEASEGLTLSVNNNFLTPFGLEFNKGCLCS